MYTCTLAENAKDGMTKHGENTRGYSAIMTVTEISMYPAALMCISGCEIHLWLPPRREMGRPIPRTSLCQLNGFRSYFLLHGFTAIKHCQRWSLGLYHNGCYAVHC